MTLRAAPRHCNGLPWGPRQRGPKVAPNFLLNAGYAWEQLRARATVLGGYSLRSTAFLVALVAILAPAFAHAANVVGTIKNLDAKANAIMLNDGGTYLLPATITTGSMKVGERVAITYALQGTKRIVTRIERSN